MEDAHEDDNDEADGDGREDHNSDVPCPDSRGRVRMPKHKKRRVAIPRLLLLSSLAHP